MPPLSSSFTVDPRQNRSFSDFSRPIGYRPQPFGPFERSVRQDPLSASFSHPSRPATGTPNHKEKIPLNPVYSKTILCKYFLKGYCVHGDSCSFAHGEHELKLTDRDKINNKHDKFKTEPCRNMYEEQFCQFGPKCIFAHAVEDLLNREIFALKPCKHYHSSKLGLCHLGKKCFYAH